MGGRVKQPETRVATPSELREARAATLSGLKYAQTLTINDPSRASEGDDYWILGDAIEMIERRWPA